MNNIKDTLYKSKNDDDSLCPQCSRPIISKRSILDNKINFNLDEFIKLSCKKCEIDFCFISCAYCYKKIYMKIHPKGMKYNGLNGFNVECPYQSCLKTFYFTQCIKCGRTQKQKIFIKEGEIIKCLYQDCKAEYIQVSCPMKYCTDILSIEKPKIHTNFPLGIMSIHKKEKEVMYQKINCYYCWRPIVYPSNKNHRNKYCECQKVICPYEDCKKVFNRIICPNPQCFQEIYVNDGWYEMGSKIKCNNCKKCFGKILCPSCGKMNVCQDHYFKFGEMKCGFQNCLKNNFLINCIYCRKLNIFNKKKPINGQVIKCGYCHNTFNEIFCPFCRLINPFPLADFSFGKVYKCKYLTCLKDFQFLICPNCFIYSFTKDIQEGKKLKCDECNILFMNWGCPFCKSNIMDKNPTLKMGQLIKCPSKKCGKIYSFIRCSKCQKLIFSNENESLLGTAVECPYQNCGAFTLTSQCPLCNTKATYSGSRRSYHEGEKITCPSCKGIYKFEKNKEIYGSGLTYLEQFQGDTIDFGIGEVDENYLVKQNLFFDKGNKKRSRLYPSQFTNDHVSLSSSSCAISNITPLEECIVCHNNKRESVFYPCGHRCVCYNCAVMLFVVAKKCPKCNEEAKCIIRKVYE